MRTRDTLIPACVWAGSLMLVLSSSADANEPTRQLLSEYCFDCHGADVQEGNVRLDALSLSASSIQLGNTLERILNVVRRGKMPPEDAAPPSAEQRSRLVDGLEQHLDRLAKELKPSLPRSRNRRLTVEEYNYTMQSLFGVSAEFGDMLPADPLAATGYSNDNARLGMSSLQIEAYLESARRAVRRYVQLEQSDHTAIRYHIELKSLYYATGDRYGSRERAPEPIDHETFRSRRADSAASPPRYTTPLGPKLPGAYSEQESMRAAIPKLHQQYVALPRRLPVGEMIVRVRAAGTPDRHGRYPRIRVEAGTAQGDGCSLNKRVLGEADVMAPRQRPATLEFRIRLEDVPSKGALNEETSFDRLSVFDMDHIYLSNVTHDELAIFALGPGGYRNLEKGSRETATHIRQLRDRKVSLLHLDAVEVEMFPVTASGNSPRWQIPLAEHPHEEIKRAESLIGTFMRAAYRRPVGTREIDAKLNLFKTLRRQNASYADSVRETLAAVLVSPAFLMRESKPPSNNVPGQGDALLPSQLAARLSYLIWLSPPDDKLAELAKDGSLTSPDALRAEAERLLDDARSQRFTESFCHQWLQLQKLANVAVRREKHPTYDDDLAADALRESLSTFDAVFRSGTNALELLDSDHAMLTDRLAQHYGLPRLTKGGIQRIQLPRDSVRGGLLSQTSVLTMNSDGADSHPIRRGVWLLERLLHDPPPPPPPNVPPIDSELSTTSLTLQERIALHRAPGACQACHEKIDPWGLAFEGFGATGRDRRTGSPEQSQNRPQSVGSLTTLPDGTTIRHFREFKRYLLEKQHAAFLDALVHHMLTYGLGRSPDFLDRPHVDRIRRRFQASNNSLKEVVLAFVESPLFREP